MCVRAGTSPLWVGAGGARSGARASFVCALRARVEFKRCRKGGESGGHGPCILNTNKPVRTERPLPYLMYTTFLLKSTMAFSISLSLLSRPRSSTWFACSWCLEGGIWFISLSAASLCFSSSRSVATRSSSGIASGPACFLRSSSSFIILSTWSSIFLSTRYLGICPLGLSASLYLMGAALAFVDVGALAAWSSVCFRVLFFST
mmetsp:Transcript_371/g.989  ORF Transcript_371/g.989 Transcript_371/m.989 type:complete len:204 (-) Transcript_371:792-1403(-)